MVFPTTAEGIAMFFRPHLRAAPEIDSRVDSSRLPIRRGVRSIGLPIWILIGAGSTDRGIGIDHRAAKGASETEGQDRLTARCRPRDEDR